MRLHIVDTHDNGWFFLTATDPTGKLLKWQPIRFDGDNVQRHIRYAYEQLTEKLNEATTSGTA